MTAVLPKASDDTRDLVALFRGVNVGGGNKLPMADLRAACTEARLLRPETYIASGNLIFASALPLREVETLLAHLLRDMFGLRVPVLIFEVAALKDIVATCPFPNAEGNRLHGLLCWTPPRIDESVFAALQVPGDGLKVVGQTVWLHTPGGFGTSKVAAKINRVITGTDFTGRNLNTLRRLAEMLDARANDC